MSADTFDMPIMDRGKPGQRFVWAVTEDDRRQAVRNHGQSLERLRERGGLCWSEMHDVLTQQRWATTDPQAANRTMCDKAVAARVTP